VVAVCAVAYLAAGGAAVASAALCALFEWAGGRRLPALVALLSGEGIPYLLGVVGMGMGPAECFAGLVPADPGSAAGPLGTVLGAGLVLAVPAMGAALAIAKGLAARPSGRRPAPAVAEAPPAAKPRRQRRSAPRRSRPGGVPSAAAEGRLRWRHRPLVRISALVCASAPLLWFTDANDARAALRICAFASAERWSDALRIAGRDPFAAASPAAQAAILRALYSTGGLPDRLFDYPVSPARMGVGVAQASVDLGGKLDPNVLNATLEQGFFALGDADLRLGLVNEHEHRAQEALSTYGEAPQALKGLALANVVKGRPEAARVFLRSLSRHIGYAAWARDTLAQLDGDPTLSSNPRVAGIRAAALERDSVEDDLSVERRLLALLDRNPANRMAFEYLMALYLLTRQPDKAVAQLARLDDFDYVGIPRTYEEAILLCQGLTGHDVNTGSRNVRMATRLAYDRFRTDYQAAMARSAGSAMAELAPVHGNTFFYYYAFGLSGVGNR
jgi:hypothetical protein